MPGELNNEIKVIQVMKVIVYETIIANITNLYQTNIHNLENKIIYFGISKIC
jgi:dsDNA-specific endonuclease/ATPase MutS2